MNQSIPSEYIIFDKRSIKDFSKLSFSKYLVSDVLKAFNKALLNCKIEESINWGVELIISGFNDKFWDKIITIGIKNSHINNPHMAFFLYSRYSKYISLIQKKTPIELRNNQSYRNLVAESCFMICNSLKTKTLNFYKIKESDFNMVHLESKMIANSPNIVSDKVKFGDPNETKIILNEFNYCLVNKRYELCVYWLSWILEWEKKNTKKDKMYICGLREIQNVDKKYHQDLVWFIWEIILKEGIKLNNDYINNAIQSLYKLYKFNFKPGQKSKKSYYLLYAIKFFTDEYHIQSSIPNYHLMIQSCLNINNIFFEKNKFSVNNIMQKEIYKFNQNKAHIEQNQQQKSEKIVKNIEKKKN